MKTFRKHIARIHNQHTSEEGFISLVGVMIASVMFLALIAMVANFTVADMQARQLSKIQSNTSTTVESVTRYLSAHPEVTDIRVVTPGCKDITPSQVAGLQVSVPDANLCLMVWGGPDDWFVRSSHPTLKNGYEYEYSSASLTYGEKVDTRASL